MARELIHLYNMRRRVSCNMLNCDEFMELLPELWCNNEQVLHRHRNIGAQNLIQNLLHGLRNQISSSTHSSVVQGHIEF